MQLGLSVLVSLCVVLNVLVCSAEEHLVPKYGMASKHSRLKRDLSAEEAELLKALLAKLELGKDSETVHGAYGNKRERGSEMLHYSHRAGVRKEDIGRSRKMEPMTYHHEESHVPRIESRKKSVVLTEAGVKALLEKMAELFAAEKSASKHEKEMFYTASVDKLPHDVHSEASHPKKRDVKMFEGYSYPDKVSDEDVSLAESLYHMKIAGDVETYPEIKMADLYNKKLADEKMNAEAEHAEHSDDSYMKKVDELGKSLIKEEANSDTEDESIREYLKKVEEGKSAPYDQKTAYMMKDFIPEMTAEEKELEAWKASHKELFPSEEKLLDEEELREKSHGMDDKLLKELKTLLAMDKDLTAKNDELLFLEKGLHKDGIEEHDEMLKKGRKVLDEKELGGEHKGILELLKLLEKEKELAHHKGKTGDIHGLTDLFFEKELSGEKTLGKGIHGTEHLFEKGLSAEKMHGIGPKDFIGSGELKREGVLTHGIDEALLKKLKASLSVDKELSEEHKEMVHLLEQLEKEKVLVEGSLAYEKAKEQAHKDAHIGYEDEKGLSADKAHGIESKEIHKTDLDVGKGLAAEKEAHGTELALEKGLSEEKDHGIAAKGVHGLEKGMEAEKAHGVDKSLHGIIEEGVKEDKKIHGMGAAFDFEKEKALHEAKAILKEEHAIGHGIGFSTDADKAFKVHEDELFKKEKGYGTDVFLHDDKEIIEAARDHHTHHVLKGEEGHILHGSDEKHHIGAADSEKGHKTLHNLKAKFFELLSSVLRVSKCHLVTMRPSELLSIVSCVSKSKDPVLCEKFALCEKKMPIRVIAALEKCQQETIPLEMKKCALHTPLLPPREIPLKMFQCVAIKVRELDALEKEKMIEFEKCARVVKAESCGRFKWLRGRH